MYSSGGSAGVNISDHQTDELVAAAVQAREKAYAPYSHFAVGAAVRTVDGTIYAGCNVENASFGLTICAERNAIAHAVVQGAREFTAIAVVTENGVTPCGACRQVLTEFNPAMMVIVADTSGHRHVYRLSELLLDAFMPAQLGR
jgi:cytidine deaminase